MMQTNIQGHLLFRVCFRGYLHGEDSYHAAGTLFPNYWNSGQPVFSKAPSLYTDLGLKKRTESHSCHPSEILYTPSCRIILLFSRCPLVGRFPFFNEGLMAQQVLPCIPKSIKYHWFIMNKYYEVSISIFAIVIKKSIIPILLPPLAPREEPLWSTISVFSDSCSSLNQCVL